MIFVTLGSDLDVNSASESENERVVNEEEDDDDDEEEEYGSVPDVSSSPFRKRGTSKTRLFAVSKGLSTTTHSNSSPAKFGSTPTVQERDSVTGIKACRYIDR